ncbi:mitogen-activated protein kinase kinase kinase kinase 4-like [Drosophila rhopaloa]|uniref:Uncharacterized protein n=1 Tax=Drosophila rhopaloa TaxID=1041015 RepID=A0ABM5JD09_DRORH|nr:mitogen-activated protein kinase kinase kinase kinase 4-like [Drosophila rhopaloa]
MSTRVTRAAARRQAAVQRGPEGPVAEQGRSEARPLPILRPTQTPRRGAEDDGARSEPEPIVTSDESDMEWAEDPVKERREWRLKRARDPKVDAIPPGYARTFKGAAKRPRGSGSTSLEMAEARAKMLRDEVERMRTTRAPYEDRRAVKKDLETAQQEWERMKQASAEAIVQEAYRLKRGEEKARKEAEVEEAKRRAEEEKRSRNPEWQQRLQKWEEEERQLWSGEVLVEAVPLIPGGMQGIPPTPRSDDDGGASRGPEAPSQWAQSDGWVPHQYPNPHPQNWHEPPPTPRPQEWPEDVDRDPAPSSSPRQQEAEFPRPPKWTPARPPTPRYDQEVRGEEPEDSSRDSDPSPPPRHPEAENPHPPKWTPARPPTPRHGQEVQEEEPEEHTKEEVPRPGGGEEQWQYCRTEIPQAHVAHALNAFVAGGVQWRQHTVTWTWPVRDEAKATEETETPAQDTPKSNPRDPRVRREGAG